jgi:hypothetical protein
MRNKHIFNTFEKTLLNIVPSSRLGVPIIKFIKFINVREIIQTPPPSFLSDRHVLTFSFVTTGPYARLEMIKLSNTSVQ